MPRGVKGEKNVTQKLSTPKSFLHSARGGVQGIVPQLSGPGGCGMGGGSYQTINKN